LSVAWDLADPFKANILFFSNFPFREDLPCAGFFIVKPNKIEQSLREWWDYRFLFIFNYYYDFIYLHTSISCSDKRFVFVDIFIVTKVI
jgi:hypothetical protein